MPFGLKNSAQAFQNLMDTVCRGLDFTFVYIDDILVASNDIATHKEHLRLLFQRLQEFGMVINVAKCQFGHDTINFLGHRINSTGSFPLPDKVQELNQPVTIKGLQEFVGMVNFCHRFIPAATQLMSPLFDALRQAQNTGLERCYGKGFPRHQESISRGHFTYAPLSRCIYFTHSSASDHVVGAVLQQLLNDTWHPLAFFSKKL